MKETRAARIAREIQKELSRIFQEQTRSTHGTLVSVTRARITADMGICTAQLSIFPPEQAEAILANIQQNSPQIRYELGRRMGKQLRIIPELRFFRDDSLDYAARLDELLK